MLGLFGSESGESGNSRQKVLLLILLIFIGAFCYLYFFTGIIVPREKMTQAPPVTAAPVKKPLPPRPEQSGTENAGATKVEAGKPEQPAQNAGAPASVQQAKPVAAVPAATPAPAQPAKSEAPKPPAEPAKAVAPKPVTAPAKTEPPKPAIAAPAPAQGQPPPALKQTSPVVEKKVAHPAAKPRNFTLDFGETVKDDACRKLLALLKKQGISPVQQKNISKSKVMHRLFLAEFGDRDPAEAELEKLSKLTKDSFLLREKQKFTVYAGSYASEKRALAEKDRLGRKGINLTMKKAEVTVAVIHVTAGKLSKHEAESAAKRLKKTGFAAKVVKLK